MNGGQPGWSTQQVLHNIEQFKSFAPTRVFVGLGVRDAQSSRRPDKNAKPSSWIATLNLFKWMKQLKKTTNTSSMETATQAPSTQTESGYRVSPDDFLIALQSIQQSFPQSDVVLYEFPQLGFSPEHSAVLAQLGAWEPPSFDDSDFFSDDPIHLTIKGHQKLAGWFLDRLEHEPTE